MNKIILPQETFQPSYKGLYKTYKSWQDLKVKIKYNAFDKTNNSFVEKEVVGTIKNPKEKVSIGSVVFSLVLEEENSIDSCGFKFKKINPDRKVEYNITLNYKLEGFLNIAETNVFGLRGTEYGFQILDIYSL